MSGARIIRILGNPYLAAGLGLIYTAILSLFSVNLIDQGVTVVHAYQLSHGLVIYRDFFLPVAPLSFMVQSVLVKFFGVRLFAQYLYLIAQSAIVLFLAADIGARRLSRPFSAIPVVCYCILGTALASYPHYNVDASFYFFVQLFILDRHLEKRRPLFAGLAALAAALSILSKQSMLPAAGLVLLAGLVLPAWKGRPGNLWREASAVLAGFGAPFFCFLVYFYRHHALQETYFCLFGVGGMKRVMIVTILPFAGALLLAALSAVYALLRISRAHPRHASWLWLLAGVVAVGGVLLGPPAIARPLLVEVVAAGIAIFTPSPKGEDPGFWVLVRCHALSLLAVSALSGVDLGHVLLAALGTFFLAGRLLEYLLERETSIRFPRIGQVATVMVVIFFVGGASLDFTMSHLSGGQEPRYKARTPFAVPELQPLRSTPEKVAAVEGVMAWVKANTKPGETIFVYPWDLLIYPLCGRMPATYYTFFYYELFDQKILRRTMTDLEISKPRVAIVGMENGGIRRVAFAAEAGTVENYLAAKYSVAADFGAYRIMTRKQENKP